jgi:hypothetical protein
MVWFYGTFSVLRPIFKISEGAVAREGGKGGAGKGVSTRSCQDNAVLRTILPFYISNRPFFA